MRLRFAPALTLASLALLASPAALPPPASAALYPAVALDGPSTSILEVDGTAMAPDGTGGIVYRKVVDGQPHVFVAAFRHGAWQPPVQADAGQPYAATFPAIAAGDGGRLLVVWVEPFATESVANPGGNTSLQTRFELYSAEIEPGAASFTAPIQVDPTDVTDGSSVSPSLSIAPNGLAYVAYRVVTNPLTPPSTTVAPLRPGDELVDVRVARFNGFNWSSLGAINRSTQVTMRRPGSTNLPQVAINTFGTEGVVVWQEPDVNGVARIWARRLFGTVPGTVLEVTTEQAGGQPINVDADEPAVAFNAYNEAVVAYRLQAGQGSPLGHAQLYVNTLPSSIGASAAVFTGAVAVGADTDPSLPSVSLDDVGNFRVVYTNAGTVRMVTGNDQGIGAPATLASGAVDPALTTIDPAGGAATTWASSDAAGLPVIAVDEGLPGGASQNAALSAPVSGPVERAHAGPVRPRRRAGRLRAGRDRPGPGAGRARAGPAPAVPDQHAGFLGHAATGGDRLGPGLRRLRRTHLLRRRRRSGPRARTDGADRDARPGRAGQRSPQRADPGHRSGRPANAQPRGEPRHRQHPADRPRAGHGRRAGDRADQRRRVGRRRRRDADLIRRRSPIPRPDPSRPRLPPARHLHGDHPRGGSARQPSRRARSGGGPPVTRRGAAVLLSVCAATVAGGAGVAHADFGPASVVSASSSPPLLADYAYEPVVSGDGRYVVFTGSIASVPAIFRKDLVTGALDVVALGADTGAPSVSADGRYVSFTTDENPGTGTPWPTPQCDNVYVRDMDVPLPAGGSSSAAALAGAFQIASAADGFSTQPLDYAAADGSPLTPVSPPTPSATATTSTTASATTSSATSASTTTTSATTTTSSSATTSAPLGTQCGAAAASGVALSADGSKVAFSLLSGSDAFAPTVPRPAALPVTPAPRPLRWCSAISARVRARSSAPSSATRRARRSWAARWSTSRPCRAAPARP